MRAFILLATAAALVLTGSASAQGRWNIRCPDHLEALRRTHRASVKREPWGLFASEDDCNMARTKKIAELDERHLRQPPFN